MIGRRQYELAGEAAMAGGVAEYLIQGGDSGMIVGPGRFRAIGMRRASV